MIMNHNSTFHYYYYFLKDQFCHPPNYVLPIFQTNQKKKERETVSIDQFFKIP